MKIKQAKDNQNIEPAMNNFQSIWALLSIFFIILLLQEMQRYVLWLYEAPTLAHTYSEKFLNNYFNWTMSYRTDSTYYYAGTNFVQVHFLIMLKFWSGKV